MELSELKELREQIDQIDDELVKLFAKRMETSADIAQCKSRIGKAVMDGTRERQKLMDVCEKTPEELREYTAALYPLLFELSRCYQGRVLGNNSELPCKIDNAIKTTPQVFPTSATVACQGVEGAYSQIACEKLFKRPGILYFSNFEAVFTAIEKGLCRYGIIPVENSTAGTVNAVYDLMMKHNFSIVRSVRLKVDHNLLANKGAKLSDIKEIYSHEQAISQCSRFLREMPDVKVISCENTAVAAKLVADSGRKDIAAISSRLCMDLYGLDCLASDIQDQGNNFTRFICISKNLEIYPGADRTSLMMVIPHKPGSLYKVLSRFYALGINLNKLESRPVPERNFEFMFYFDLDTPIYSPQLIQLMGEIQDLTEDFVYMGSYSEVV